MSEFLMPSLGADMESAVLMEWHVKEGDHVNKGDVIAEVETSKGVIEIEVFTEGTVEKLLVKEETECKVGAPLAIIADGKEDAKKEEPVVKVEQKPAKKVIEKADKPKETVAVNIQTDRIKASPAARKKAKELGVELSSVAKKNNPVQLKDLGELKKETSAEKTEKEELKPADKSKADLMRDAIAKAMSLSNKEIPHYYLSTTVNMTPSLIWLEELNKKKSIADRILPAALLIKASVKALEEVPELNGFWKEGVHEISKEINPGVAIALRKGGLITPALLDAGTLDLDKTMKKFGDLIKRTRSGKLKSSELTKQTITITNLGDLGVDEVLGVIYPPQVALIGFGKIHESPWAVNDTIAVRKVLKATVAGDHRATDGRTGALFLDKLDKILQNPGELL